MKIEKKEGIINQIVYDETVYNNGNNRYYPNISGLIALLKKIIQANTTTNYVRITPFYVNDKLERQIEFEEFMFFVECKENIVEQTAEERTNEYFMYTDYYCDLLDDKVKWASILYPLCKTNDIESFKKCLEKYIDFLDVMIPLLMNISRKQMNLKDEDIGFGYFCFEVHSD